ncbi:hypothetical protein MRX96_005706 [Rhipicephalus microplus]
MPCVRVLLKQILTSQTNILTSACLAVVNRSQTSLLSQLHPVCTLHDVGDDTSSLPTPAVTISFSSSQTMACTTMQTMPLAPPPHLPNTHDFRDHQENRSSDNVLPSANVMALACGDCRGIAALLLEGFYIEW